MPMGKRTVSTRIEVEADRLAKVDAAYAGVSKSAWISRLIREAHARSERGRDRERARAEGRPKGPGT